MKISVVIPCLNEEHNLAALLRLLESAREIYQERTIEVIVVDGGSSDRTADVVGNQYKLLRTKASRAHQMNAGAAVANGEVLYFIHADTRPPLECFRDIYASVQAGNSSGGYAFQFDKSNLLLDVNSYFTTFNILSTRGGDQSLYVVRELFEELGGFNEEMVIMEEYDLMKRIQELGYKHHLLDGQTIVSSRKYRYNSWLRVQLANLCAISCWRAGVDSREIQALYARMLNKPRP